MLIVVRFTIKPNLLLSLWLVYVMFFTTLEVFLRGSLFSLSYHLRVCSLCFPGWPKLGKKPRRSAEYYYFHRDRQVIP